MHCYVCWLYYRNFLCSVGRGGGRGRRRRKHTGRRRGRTKNWEKACVWWRDPAINWRLVHEFAVILICGKHYVVSMQHLFWSRVFSEALIKELTLKITIAQVVSHILWQRHGSLWGQSMWSTWWAWWQWNRYFQHALFLSCKLSFYQCSILIHHYRVVL